MTSSRFDPVLSFFAVIGLVCTSLFLFAVIAIAGPGLKDRVFPDRGVAHTVLAKYITKAHTERYPSSGGPATKNCLRYVNRTEVCTTDVYPAGTTYVIYSKGYVLKLDDRARAYVTPAAYAKYQVGDSFRLKHGNGELSDSGMVPRIIRVPGQ